MKALPEILRETLKEPIGPVATGKELEDILRKAEMLVTIGDVVTSTALSLGITPNISIVDGSTRRGDGLALPHGDWDIEAWAYNPPAVITDALMKIIERAIENMVGGQKTLVVVDGEEDLASLPCILLAPFGTTIIYGMPDVGVAVVQVDQRSKEVSKDILDQMEMI